jgi:hypothetical protein
MPSIRRRYYADYTESMKTETLLLIRVDLMKDNSHLWEGSWEAKRLARINQVLKSRNQLPK